VGRLGRSDVWRWASIGLVVTDGLARTGLDADSAGRLDRQMPGRLVVAEEAPRDSFA
jgi:hypothetical protein